MGETGTGKNLVAQAIHEHDSSPRRNSPCVSVNGAAIPEPLFEMEFFGCAPRSGIANADPKGKPGKLELADGGTFFLNEIGDIPLFMQAKLLDFFDSKEVTRLSATKPKKVNVRIITGTHQPLEQMVKDKRFREDLYYRVRVIEINMPALRERREDIPLLCEHFIVKHAQEKGSTVQRISADAIEILQSYSWPGNVRELENVIRRAIIEADNKDVIDENNEIIAEIAKGVQSTPSSVESSSAKPESLTSQADEGEERSFVNMTSINIWQLIKDGKVRRARKTLPEWVQEIGTLRTLEIVELVKKEYRGYPSNEELHRMFDMTYTAFKTRVFEYKKKTQKQSV